MIYRPAHCEVPAHVFDVEAGAELARVLSVDPETGVVTCSYQPARVDRRANEIESFQVRFRSIHAICGVRGLPTLFHCYGRLPETA